MVTIPQPSKQAVHSLLIAFLLIIYSPLLFGENAGSFELELYNNLVRDSSGSWYYSPYGNAGFNIDSVNNRNVKGGIEINFVPYDTEDRETNASALELEKAYIKIRFADTRLTVGKTRVTWGEGTVFNAGDILFGSTGPEVDMLSEEKRDETAWLTLSTFPLGHYSFFETIVMPASYNVSSAAGGKVEDACAGARLYVSTHSFKFETGYLYKGEKKTESDPDVKTHRPYIGIQGNMGPDFSVTASAAIPAEESPSSDFIRKSLALSLSLFNVHNTGNESKLSLRLEGMIRPFQYWEEKEFEFGIMESYGIYLYPEIIWSPFSYNQLSLQAIVSPIDLSAVITAGSSINLYQGLYFLNYITFNAGDSSDIFQSGYFSLATGAKYRF